MAKVKLLLSAVTLAAFSSLPVMAQSSTPQTSTPQSTDSQSTQQTSPGTTTQNQQTLSGNHSDPNATPADANRPAQSGSGDGQQPTSAQPDPGMGQGTGQQSKGEAVPVQHTASVPEVANAALRPVRTELVGKLDSKNAKAGDAVVLKTTEKATIANGVVIPKGTKITGQVVDAKPHTSANKNAQVTVQFTKAELKGGQTLPIQSVLQSVGPSDSAATTADMGGAPSGVMGGSSVQSAGSGTMAGGASASSGSMTGTAGAGGSQMAQANAGAATPGVATAANGAPAPGTVVAQQGSVQIKTTALPGVLVETNADGKPFSNASGAFLGASQNIHLDGGTRVDLAIADASAKPQNR